MKQRSMIMKKKYTKVLTLILAAILILSFSACSDSSTNGNTENGFIFKNDESPELGTPDKTLNPEEIYSNLTYTPEMFYGNYKLFGGKDAENKYAETAEYAEYTIAGETKVLTTLPIQFIAGKNNLNHKLTLSDGQDWAQVSFMRKLESGSYVLDYYYCAYEVNGNKLTIKPLDDFNIDDANNKITYDLSDAVMTYDFSFKGRIMTLSDGTNSIELNGALDPYGEHDYFYVSAYSSVGSKQIDGIYCFEFLYNPETKDLRFIVSNPNDGFIEEAIANLEENGLFTFTVITEESTKTYQYVYFYNDEDGLILTDGTDIFYYNLDYTDYHKQDITKYTSEEQEGMLNALEENDIKAIVEKTDDLLTELADAFKAADINVNIDKTNGELAVDSSILFGGDSADLSNEGKAFLNKFVEIYSSIIFSDEYSGFISKTIIEGHTAPLQGSTYESGLPLSQQRADVVKDYCLSDETGLDTTNLAASLEAVGMSNSNPIMDNDGNVNLEASRRVSFKFVINIG